MKALTRRRATDAIIIGCTLMAFTNINYNADVVKGIISGIILCYFTVKGFRNAK